MGQWHMPCYYADAMLMLDALICATLMLTPDADAMPLPYAMLTPCLRCFADFR